MAHSGVLYRKRTEDTKKLDYFQGLLICVIKVRNKQ